jgi:hypothetical protein
LGCLIITTKQAKALGFTLSRDFWLIADEAIE